MGTRWNLTNEQLRARNLAQQSSFSQATDTPQNPQQTTQEPIQTPPEQQIPVQPQQVVMQPPVQTPIQTPPVQSPQPQQTSQTQTSQVPKIETPQITKDTNWSDVTDKSNTNLERLIEARYGTVATQNQDGTLSANIGGKQYNWTNTNGNLIKTEVPLNQWSEDSIFAWLMSGQKIDATTPQGIKAQGRYDVANRYLGMTEDQLYSAYANGEIGSQLERDIAGNPYLAQAKEKYNRKLVTDNINKESASILNAYNKANGKQVQTLETQSATQTLSDKFTSLFSNMGKENDIPDFQNYLVTNYPDLQAKSEELNAKDKLLKEKADQRDARLDEIIKENPWISINRATMLAARQNKDLNSEIKAMSYEISNLSADINYQTSLAEKWYNSLQTQQARQDQLAQEQRGYAFDILKTQEQRAYEEEQATKQLEQQYAYQYGDLNSENPTLQNIAIERAVAGMYQNYPLPWMESQATKVQKVKDLMAQGMTGEQAIAQLEQEIRGTQRYKDYIASEQRALQPQAPSIQDIGWSQYQYNPTTRTYEPLNVIDITREQATKNYGTTPAVRNFNPWNIMDTGFGGQKVAWERFTRFETPQAGFNALVAKIENIQAGNSNVYSPDMTLLQYISKYAPASDNNNPGSYANAVAKNLWITTSTKIKDIDATKLAEEHARHEDGNSYRMLKDLGIIWWEKSWEVKDFTDTQKNIMSSIDIKNPTKVDEAILSKSGLTLEDAYNYKESLKQGKWSQWLDDIEYKRVNTVIDDLASDQVTKTFKKSQEAYNFATKVKAWDNATDNQALIYAFAKAMDPDSVVREWEYATVQKYSQVWWDKLGMNINRILNGQEFISKSAKDNIVNTIKSKYDASKDSYESLRNTKIKMINDIAWKDIWDKALPSDVMQLDSSTIPTEDTKTPTWWNTITTPQGNTYTY